MKTNTKILLGATIFMGVLTFGSFQLGRFSYHWQSPILLQKPLIISKLVAEAMPEPITVEQAQEVIKHQEELTRVVDSIYGLESSYGKADSCNKSGKFNGYGYRQNSVEHKCFDSHETVRALVAQTINGFLNQGMTLDQALCTYNKGLQKTGKPEDSCTYSRNYHLLYK